MKLSIIIVNYKTPQLLLDCLESVFKYGSKHLEVIVVDNDSRDNSEQLLKENYPQVRYIQMGYNAGFARANNKGIEVSSGEAVLLLNSDTINLNNAIDHCFHRLMSGNFAAAGVQLLNADMSPQISGNYTMTGGLNHLLPLPVSGKLLGMLAKSMNIRKTNLPQVTGVAIVDWINGAFLMVKRSVLLRSGLLDGDFFLYFEEAEWCSRIKKIGSLVIYGDLHVIHLQGESAGAAFSSKVKGYFNLFDRKGFQLMLSSLLRIRKQFGLGWFAFHVAAYFLTIPIYFFAVIFSLLSKPGHFKMNMNNWKAYTQNCIRLFAFIPQIVGGKPFFYKVL